MFLLKKLKIIIFTCLILFVFSCEAKKNKELKQSQEKEVTENPLATAYHLFFQEISKKEWEIPELEKLGFQIMDLDSLVQFYKYNNSYEHNAFIFSANAPNHLNNFLNHPFLASEQATTNQDYQVWRKEIDGQKLLDISVEPHPVLKHVLIFRKRTQE